MVNKLISPIDAKPGKTIMVEGIACVVKSNDASKTGRHGHTKCRIEAVSILDGKKKVFIIAGHNKLEVPLINKSRAQLLSITGNKASLMDLETYETLELPISEELKEQVKDGDHVEYWDVEGTKMIKRTI